MLYTLVVAEFMIRYDRRV